MSVCVFSETVCNVVVQQRYEYEFYVYMDNIWTPHRIGKKAVEVTVTTNLEGQRSEAEVAGKYSKEGGE